MKEQLEHLAAESLEAVAAANDMAALDALRVKYLGKKGALTAILKQMGRLSAEERPAMGQLANSVRAELEAALDGRRAELEAAAMEARLEAEALDVTLPGKRTRAGRKHPMDVVIDELKDIFVGMGFEIDDGPEVEESVYNFDRLNTDEGHPAREWTDTFYLDEESRTLLRTQTSNMEPRIMETRELPIRAAVFGRCYRKDEVDATHSPMFHQMEGVVVDEHITFADLKGLLHNMAVQLYGPNTVTRFRPHHTYPSFALGSSLSSTGMTLSSTCIYALESIFCLSRLYRSLSYSTAISYHPHMVDSLMMIPDSRYCCIRR